MHHATEGLYAYIQADCIYLFICTKISYLSLCACECIYACMCGQEEDLVEFTKRQKDFPEEWENLKSEIFAIATGTGVTRIEGDQVWLFSVG